MSVGVYLETSFLTRTTLLAQLVRKKEGGSPSSEPIAEETANIIIRGNADNPSIKEAADYLKNKEPNPEKQKALLKQIEEKLLIRFAFQIVVEIMGKLYDELFSAAALPQAEGVSLKEGEEKTGVSLKKKKKIETPEEGAQLIRKKTSKSSAPTEIDILINQDFYLPGYSKVALIRSNNRLTNGKFKLIKDEEVIYEGLLKEYGKYSRWGEEIFYFADFSEVNKEGSFKLVVEYPGGKTETTIDIKSVDLDKALADAAKYFYYQRCGTEIPGWHKACHTNDPQGTSGGWHDAGDYNKYIYTQWQPAWALLGLYEETKESKYLEEAKWGIDFLAKMVKEDGSMWSAIFGGWGWTRPEQDGPRQLTRAQWGDPTWAVATCSATFAKMAKNTSGSKRTKYLRLAKLTNRYFKEHFNFKHIPRGEDFQGLGGIVFSDLILYDLTKESSYLESAEKNTKLILAHQDKRGFFFSDDKKDEPFWDDYETYFFVEALGKYAKQFPRNALTTEIKASFSKLMEGHLKILAYNTPYRQMQWLDPFDSHPANGEVFDNFYLKLIEGWVRGSNSYYLSSANTAMVAYSLLEKEEYKDIAINQLNWVLGVNPYGVSMMEGHCQKCTQRYHHRYDTLPGHTNGAVPGGITNGIASNDGEDYFYDVLGNTWASNETWLPHNAWFIMLGLKLNDYLKESAPAPLLPISKGEVRRTAKPIEEEKITVIKPTGKIPNLEYVSTIRNGLFKDEGESIGVDIVFKIADLPPEVILLKSFIFTNQIYPQGEAKVNRDKTTYVFKAYLYKLNKFSGFFIQGYDKDGKMVFQTETYPIPLPPE